MKYFILIMMVSLVTSFGMDITGHKGFAFGMSPTETKVHAQSLDATDFNSRNENGRYSKDSMITYIESVKNADVRLTTLARKFNISRHDPDMLFKVTRIVMANGEGIYQLSVSLTGQLLIHDDVHIQSFTIKDNNYNLLFTNGKLRHIERDFGDIKYETPALVTALSKKYGKPVLHDDGYVVDNAKTMRYEFATSTGKMSVAIMVNKNRDMEKAVEMMKTANFDSIGTENKEEVYTVLEDKLKSLQKQNLLYIGYYDNNYQTEMNVAWESTILQYRAKELSKVQKKNTELAEEF